MFVEGISPQFGEAAVPGLIRLTSAMLSQRRFRSASELAVLLLWAPLIACRCLCGGLAHAFVALARTQRLSETTAQRLGRGGGLERHCSVSYLYS